MVMAVNKQVFAPNYDTLMLRQRLIERATETQIQRAVGKLEVVVPDSDFQYASHIFTGL